MWGIFLHSQTTPVSACETTPTVCGFWNNLMHILIIFKFSYMITLMNDASPEDVQMFYEENGFEATATQDKDGNPETAMTKNCTYVAEYFIPESGNEPSDSPFWRTSQSGKEFCLLMGKAKVKGFPELSRENMVCLLNKKSYDAGEFELNTRYSSICKVPLLDTDGNKHQDFNDIYFTVFENEATNNDMSDLAADKFQAFLARKKAQAEE